MHTKLPLIGPILLGGCYTTDPKYRISENNLSISFFRVHNEEPLSSQSPAFDCCRFCPWGQVLHFIPLQYVSIHLLSFFYDILIMMKTIVMMVII